MGVHPVRSLVRFGVFEVDRGSGELRKRGVRIRLQEQPLKILMLLLDRPCEIVTREQLRQILWPEGTFVDFEHSLNAAVAKLRQSVGDSAENPRFVETIPRRGYRFIAPVEESSASAAGQTTARDPPVAEPVRSRLHLIVIGVILLLAAVLAWMFRA